MAVASATVTAKTGPATQVTSQALAQISAINVDFARQVIQFSQGSGPSKEYDLTGVTTLTITTPGGNATIVVS